MVKTRDKSIQKWIIDLANKHGISVETVYEFYMNLKYDHNKPPLKKRTIEFFDLYFEGIREGV